tara:strand:- start:6957 stop:11564 length:4608 start_codon:yes stop_codon:yes gene_type:complete
MPRDISRNTNQIGSSKKTPPKVDDPIVQKAINAIFTELNKLELSVSKEPIGAHSNPSDGESGDVRLYTKKAEDGTTGYFIQGKFGDAWASGRLGVDLVDPNLPITEQTTVASYTGDGGSYITKLGVTFDNLAFNNDVGVGATQVAIGNHNHNHDLLDNNGEYLHSEIDTHINDSTIHFLLGDIPTATPTVSNTASAGVSSTAAKSDHMHMLNVHVDYDFQVGQSFYSSDGNAITADGDVSIVGDVDITGDLSVDYAVTGDGSGNLTLSGDADIAETLTVGLKSTLANTDVLFQATTQDPYQIRIGHDATKSLDITVTSTGLTTLKSASDGIQFDTPAVAPYNDNTTDFGSADKRWKSIFASELVVETLVAQGVMATIGGKIMVAPTTQLQSALNTTATTITVGHNLFEQNDYIYLRTGVDGNQQTEIMQVTSSETANGNNFDYTVVRNIDNSGIGANEWATKDAVVNLGHKQSDGYVEITATQSIHGSDGPSISLFSRTNTYDAATSEWNDASELVRLGNLKGTGYTLVDRYGLIVGENVDNAATDVTDPFKGLVVADGDFKLFNTNIESYTGSSRSIYLGQDLRSGYEDKVAFVMGNAIGINGSNEWENDSLKFEWLNGQYNLTITGQIDILDANTNANVISYRFGIDNTLDAVGETSWSNGNTIANIGFTLGEKLFYHVKIRNAQSDVKVQFTESSTIELPGDVITWVDIQTQIDQGHTNDLFSKWYTFSYEPTVLGGSKAFRVIMTDANGSTTGDVSVYDHLITSGVAGNPDAIKGAILGGEAIPGGSDFTLNNTITIGSGSITIGNQSGNSIKSYGKDSYSDPTSGFFLGTASDGSGGTSPRFAVGDDTSYLKYTGIQGPGDDARVEIGIGGDSDGGVRIGSLLSDGTVSKNKEILLGSWQNQAIGSTYGNIPADEGVLVKHGEDDWTSISSSGISRRDHDFPILVHNHKHIGMPTRPKISAFQSSSDFENTRARMTGVNLGTSWAEDQFWNEEIQTSYAGYDDFEGKRAGEALWNTSFGNQHKDYGDANNQSGAFNARSGYITGLSGNYHGYLPWYWESSYNGNSNGLTHSAPGGGLSNQQSYFASSSNSSHDKMTPLFTDRYWGARDYYHGKDINLYGDTYNGDTNSTGPTYGRGTNFYYEEPTSNLPDGGGIRNAYRLSRNSYGAIGMNDHRTDFFNAENGGSGNFSNSNNGNPWRNSIYPYDVSGAHIGYWLCKSFGAGGLYPDTVPEGRKLIYEISGANDDNTGKMIYWGISPGFHYWNWGFYGGIMGFGVLDNKDFKDCAQIVGAGSGGYMVANIGTGPFGDAFQSLAKFGEGIAGDRRYADDDDNYDPDNESGSNALFPIGQDRPINEMFLYNLKKTSTGTRSNIMNRDGTLGVSQGEFFDNLYAGYQDDESHTSFFDGLYCGANFSPWGFGTGSKDERATPSEIRTKRRDTWAYGPKDYFTDPNGNNAFFRQSKMWQGMEVIVNFKRYLEKNTKVFKGEIGPGEDVSSLHIHATQMMAFYDHLGPAFAPMALIPHIKIWETDA